MTSFSYSITVGHASAPVHSSAAERRASKRDDRSQCNRPAISMVISIPQAWLQPYMNDLEMAGLNIGHYTLT